MASTITMDQNPHIQSFERTRSLNRLYSFLRLGPSAAEELKFDHVTAPPLSPPPLATFPSPPSTPPPPYSTDPDSDAASWTSTDKTAEVYHAAEKFIKEDPQVAAEEAKFLREAIDFLTSLAEPGYGLAAERPRLSHPVAVPQLKPGAASPFARVWAQDLAPLAVQRDDFLTIVDHLNRIITPTPGVVFMYLAAFGAQFAPVDGREAIAFGLYMLASFVAELVARIRSARFVDLANRVYMHPRGLHCRIVTTSILRRAANIPASEPLIAPLSEEALKVTSSERFISHLTAYCARLDFDVPAPPRHPRRLGRLATWYLNFEVRSTNRSAQRGRRRSWKRMQKGKKVRREGWVERIRASNVLWLLIQNIDDYERDVRQVRENQMRRAREREDRRRARRQKITGLLRRSATAPASIAAAGLSLEEKISALSITVREPSESKSVSASTNAGRRLSMARSLSLKLKPKPSQAEVELGVPVLADYPTMMWRSAKAAFMR